MTKRILIEKDIEKLVESMLLLEKRGYKKVKQKIGGKEIEVFKSPRDRNYVYTFVRKEKDGSIVAIAYRRGKPFKQRRPFDPKNPTHFKLKKSHKLAKAMAGEKGISSGAATTTKGVTYIPIKDLLALIPMQDLTKGDKETTEAVKKRAVKSGIAVKDNPKDLDTTSLRRGISGGKVETIGNVFAAEIKPPITSPMPKKPDNIKALSTLYALVARGRRKLQNRDSLTDVVRINVGNKKYIAVGEKLQGAQPIATQPVVKKGETKKIVKKSSDITIPKDAVKGYSDESGAELWYSGGGVVHLKRPDGKIIKLNKKQAKSVGGLGPSNTKANTTKLKTGEIDMSKAKLAKIVYKMPPDAKMMHKMTGADDGGGDNSEIWYSKTPQPGRPDGVMYMKMSNGSIVKPSEKDQKKLISHYKKHGGDMRSFQAYYLDESTRINRKRIRMMIKESVRKQIRLNEFDMSNPMGTLQQGVGLAKDLAGGITQGKLPAGIPNILDQENISDLITMDPSKLGGILEKIPGGITEDTLSKNPLIFFKLLEMIPGVGPFVADLEDAVGDEFEDYAAEVLEESKKQCVKFPILKMPPYEIDYKCAGRIAREKAQARMNAQTIMRVLNNAGLGANRF